MRGMDKKGFILTETLVVSVVLLVSFTFVFTQFLTIFASYKLFENYKDVDALYTSINIERFITQDNTENLTNRLEVNKLGGKPYYEFTNCQEDVFVFFNQCLTIINESHVARAFIVDYDLSNLVEFNYDNDFSYELKKYIEFLNKEKEVNLIGDYRIIIEMDNGNFASRIVNPKIAFPSKQQYRYKQAYLSFDGTDDYIDLPSDLGYTTTVSAFAWFKHNGSPLGDFHIILGGQHLEISVHSSGYLRTGVYTNARYVDNYGSGLNDGNWHYIGFTFDGTNKMTYIDGLLVGTQTVSGTLTNVVSSRRIGRYGDSTAYYLNGTLKEVAIYNRILNIIEINNNMNNIDMDTSGLVAYYKLSEGIGTTLYDYSNNHGNAGNAINGPTWVKEYSFSPWIDGTPTEGMYPEVETRIVYFYNGTWLTENELP
ncbi:MAG: LamG domain-containing protein [Bacilli bacterium]|nr:LamG domain-containing protein [Bacilli bacterium]